MQCLRPLWRRGNSQGQRRLWQILTKQRWLHCCSPVCHEVVGFCGGHSPAQRAKIGLQRHMVSWRAAEPERFLNQCLDKSLSVKLEKLKASIAEAEKVGGMADGTHWLAGLDPLTFTAMLEHAQSTILKQGCPRLPKPLKGTWQRPCLYALNTPPKDKRKKPGKIGA